MAILLNQPGLRRPPDGALRVNKSSRQYAGLIHWWSAAARFGPLYMGDRGLEPTDGILAITGAIPAYSRGSAYDLGVSIYHQGLVGQSNFVNVGDIELTAPFSLTVWFRPDYTNGTGAQAYAKLISKATTTNSDPYTLYALGMTNNSPAVMQFGVSTGGAGSAVSANSTTTILSGRLYHLVGVYDGAKIRIYVNGKLENSASTTLTVGTSTQNTLIGQLRTSVVSDNQFKGWINDVRIYNRALSAADVAQMYAPMTRWELYRKPDPASLFLLMAAGGGPPPGGESGVNARTRWWVT